MSRGHGKIERAVLDYLASLGANEWQVTNRAPLHAVLEAVYGTIEPTASQKTSLRRALRKLESEGLVERDDRDVIFPWEQKWGKYAREYRREYGKRFYENGQWWIHTTGVTIVETWWRLAWSRTPEQEARAAESLRKVMAAITARG